MQPIASYFAFSGSRERLHVLAAWLRRCSVCRRWPSFGSGVQVKSLPLVTTRLCSASDRPACWRHTPPARTSPPKAYRSVCARDNSTWQPCRFGWGHKIPHWGGLIFKKNCPAFLAPERLLPCQSVMCLITEGAAALIMVKCPKVTSGLEHPIKYKTQDPPLNASNQ